MAFPALESGTRNFVVLPEILGTSQLCVCLFVQLENSSNWIQDRNSQRFIDKLKGEFVPAMCVTSNTLLVVRDISAAISFVSCLKEPGVTRCFDKTIF